MMRSNIKDKLIRGALGIGLVSVVAASDVNANTLSRLRFSGEYGIALDTFDSSSYQSLGLRINEEDGDEFYGKVFVRTSDGNGKEDLSSSNGHSTIPASIEKPQYWGEPKNERSYFVFRDRDIGFVIGKELLTRSKEHPVLNGSIFGGLGFGLSQGRLTAESPYNEQDHSGRSFNQYGLAWELGAYLHLNVIGAGVGAFGVHTGHGFEQEKFNVKAFIKAGQLY